MAGCGILRLLLTAACLYPAPEQMPGWAAPVVEMAAWSVKARL